MNRETVLDWGTIVLAVVIGLILGLLIATSSTEGAEPTTPTGRQELVTPAFPVVQVLSKRAGYVEHSSGIPVGMLPSGDRLFLTAGHAVGRFWPTEIKGVDFQVPARLLAHDTWFDTAVLAAKLPASSGMRTWTIAGSFPEGTSCSWGGFKFRPKVQYQQLTAPTYIWPEQRYAEVSLKGLGVVEPGMSGGPVYRNTGVLVGMVIKYRTDCSIAVRGNQLIKAVEDARRIDQQTGRN